MSKLPPIGDRAAGPASLELEQLRLLLEIYGARPDRWPPEQRNPAQALLAESSEARRLAAAAARLDAALDLWPAPQASAELLSRVLAGAPTGTQYRPRRVSGRWVIAITVPLVAAAAVVIWLAPRHASPRTPTPLAISELGVYTTPTDVLLVPPGVDLSRSKPALGCDEDGLGCPLNEPPAEGQSRGHARPRVFG